MRAAAIGLAAVGGLVQRVLVEDAHAPAGDLDHAILVQATEAAADRFQRQAEVARDLVAAHRQAEIVSGPADAPVALAQPVQEQGDPLAGLAARQHVDVIVVTVRALPDHPQQLLLQAGQLRGDGSQAGERQFADPRLGQRHRVAAVLAAADRIQPEQFAGQVEAEHVLLAGLVDADGLERAFAGHVHRAQRLAGTEQGFAGPQRLPALDHRIQPAQVIAVAAGRQAQALQRAFPATTAQTGQVQGNRRSVLGSHPAIIGHRGEECPFTASARLPI